MSTKRQWTAYHEAGHAVVAHYLGIGIHRVTIVPDHDCAGALDHGDLFCGPGSDRAKLERAIQFCLAGPLAQKRFDGRNYRQRHGRGDYDCASGLARYLAGSSEREYLQYQERRTWTLIDRWWDDIGRVARALVERDQLDGAEVKDIIETLMREARVDRARWAAAMADDVI